MFPVFLSETNRGSLLQKDQSVCVLCCFIGVFFKHTGLEPRFYAATLFRPANHPKPSWVFLHIDL